MSKQGMQRARGGDMLWRKGSSERTKNDKHPGRGRRSSSLVAIIIIDRGDDSDLCDFQRGVGASTGT